MTQAGLLIQQSRPFLSFAKEIVVRVTLFSLALIACLSAPLPVHAKQVALPKNSKISQKTAYFRHHQIMRCIHDREWHGYDPRPEPRPGEALAKAS